MGFVQQVTARGLKIQLVAGLEEAWQRAVFMAVGACGVEVVPVRAD